MNEDYIQNVIDPPEPVSQDQNLPDETILTPIANSNEAGAGPLGPLPDSEPNPKRLRGFLVELIQTVVMALVLFLIIDSLTARIQVQSISMQPTLYEDDYVLVNKLAYRLGMLQRQDIIVFRPPINEEGEPYIKRLIGLPGDSVRVVGGLVYVNDQPLEENYLKAPPGYNGIWSVPEDMVFVLGDNRNNSQDSHSWGMVPVDNIIGEALVIYWPFGHWKVLDHQTAVAAAP